MTPADRQTLARKLEYLRKNLDMLITFREMEKETLTGENSERFAAERLLQTAIESVIDCARLIATLEDWRGMRDERDALLILAEQEVIDSNLAQKLLRAKGFRNVLVHEYVAVDPVRMVAFLKSDVDDLRTFAIALAQWLNDHPDSGSE